MWGMSTTPRKNQLRTLFFNQGRSQRDLEAFMKQRQNYTESHQRERNYNHVLAFCTKGPERYEENAIESSSIATASAHLSAVKHNAAGDNTTWGEVPGANCTEAKGPPQWHRSQKVDVHLQTPTEENRCQRRGRERSPFDHLRWQPTKSLHDFAPGSSFHTPASRSSTSRRTSYRQASSRSPRPDNTVCRTRAPAPDSQKKPALLQTKRSPPQGGRALGCYRSGQRDL